MGNSWSNRRRNNYFQNRPPPPPPLPPPPPQYLSSPTFPPLPPPRPPPYHAPNNLYSTHPPPPAHSHYCHHPNSMMGGYNYQPNYGNQANRWPGNRWPENRALVGQFHPQQMVAPPPYVEHQNAKKVRNDVNVHKDSLRVEVDDLNPDQHLVSFVFDAVYDGSITILYFAKEEPDRKFVPLYPDAFMPVRIPFQKGSGQKFRQPSGTGIDLGFFELYELAKASPNEDVFPLVISAETNPLTDSVDDHLNGPVQDRSANLQITQAVLEKSNRDSFQVKVIRQVLWVDGVRYELREIYGIGSSAAEGIADNDSGRECVICMTEPKDTFVLPCRHMCMCSECAKELRLQSNKCPICRQPIEEIVGIKINNGDQ